MIPREQALQEALQELLDVFIEGGYAEPEDEDLLNRCFDLVNDDSVGTDPTP